MPYMIIEKGEDLKWHHNLTKNTCKIKLTGEKLRIGGGKNCGNDEDPASEEMCFICFPWVEKRIKNNS